MRSVARFARVGSVGVGLVAVIVGGAVLPAAAGASTTFGADMTQSPANASFINSITNVVAPGGGPDTGAPVTGVLVSARVKTRGAAITGAIRVLRETARPDSNTYTLLNVAPEIPVSVTTDATPGGHVTQVSTRQPIVAGDRLGWYANDLSSGTFSGYTDPSAECAYNSSGSHPPGTQHDYTTISCNHDVELLSGTIELDADGDGYGDETQDLCPSDSSTHGVCPDADGDGVFDSVDNCPTTANATQANTDGDSQGDACDADDDNDGIADTMDSCPVLRGAGTASGCPAASETLTLSYSSRHGRFKGRLAAGALRDCLGQRQVSVWKRVPGPDRRVGRKPTKPSGAYKLRADAAPGKYYSSVNTQVLPGTAECASASSPKSRVR